MEDRYRLNNRYILDKEWKYAKFSDLVNKVIQIDGCSKKLQKYYDNIR